MSQGICQLPEAENDPSQQPTKKEGPQSCSHVQQKSANVLNEPRSRFETPHACLDFIGVHNYCNILTMNMFMHEAEF